MTPQTAAHQAPPSLGFSRQEYWSGLPSPPPEDLPDPGMEPASLMTSVFNRKHCDKSFLLGFPFLCGILYIATAAAKSLQSCLTLCDPTDGSPPGSAVPGILQARTLEWVAISFSNA